MAKKGPIGKAEAFYIEQHLAVKTEQEIAEDLDRTITSVKTFMKKNKLKAEKPKTILDQSIVRHKGGAVMTETASSISDTKRRISKEPNKSCVAKIK
jgi:hypothetical protein